MEKEHKRVRGRSYDKGRSIKEKGRMLRQKKEREEEDKEKAWDEEASPEE